MQWLSRVQQNWARPDAVNRMRCLKFRHAVRAFSASSQEQGFLQQTAELGVFGLPWLRRPDDLKHAAQTATGLCNSLVEALHAVAQQTVPEESERSGTVSARVTASLADGDPNRIVATVDAVSDLLCRVVDVAEVVRLQHADDSWKEAASAAHAQLSSTIAALNADRGLFLALDRALRLDAASQAGLLDAEGRRVASTLRTESLLGGNALPGPARSHLMQLVEQAGSLASAYYASLGQITEAFTVPSAQSLKGLPSYILRSLPPSPTRDGPVQLPADASVAQAVVVYSQDPEARAAAWKAMRPAGTKAQGILDNIAAVRHGMARVLDLRGFLDYAFHSRMADSPETVLKVLHTLSAELRPLAARELQQLLRVSQPNGSHPCIAEGGGGDHLPSVAPWDLEHHMPRARSKIHSLALGDVTPYLSMASVLHGIRLVAHRVLGVSLQPVELGPQESWDGGAQHIKKFAAVDVASGRFLGVVLLDLVERGSKLPGAAHFVVRCGHAPYAGRSLLDPPGAASAQWRAEDTAWRDGDGTASAAVQSSVPQSASAAVAAALAGGAEGDGSGRSQQVARGAAADCMQAALHDDRYVVPIVAVSASCVSNSDHEEAFRLAGRGPRGGGGQSHKGGISGWMNGVFSSGGGDPLADLPVEADAVHAVLEASLKDCRHEQEPVWGQGVLPEEKDLCMTPSKAETLFHECGHALHSLLSRTRYQHLNGTRCPLDFVEVPSHLFEYWFRDPKCLQEWARDSSGQGMPAELAKKLHGSRTAFGALRMQSTMVQALTDLAMFSHNPAAVAVAKLDPVTKDLCFPPTGQEISVLRDAVATAVGRTALGGGITAEDAMRVLRAMGAKPPKPGDAGAIQDVASAVRSLLPEGMLPDDPPPFSWNAGGIPLPESAQEETGPDGQWRIVPPGDSVPSSLVDAAVLGQHSCRGHVPGTAPHVGYSHAVNYGGGYYTYVLAQLVASAIWEKHFQDNPWDRTAGSLWREALQTTGVRPCDEVLQDVLGMDALSQPGDLIQPFLRELNAAAAAAAATGEGAVANA